MGRRSAQDASCLPSASLSRAVLFPSLLCAPLANFGRSISRCLRAGKTIPNDGPYFGYTLHEPIGVVGQVREGAIVERAAARPVKAGAGGHSTGPHARISAPAGCCRR